MQMGIEVPHDSVTITGPVKTYQSSSFAERAWCDACGSALWFRDTEGPNSGWFELAPGLFDNAAGARQTREVYSDRCPEGYALAREHERVTRAEYEQKYAHVADDPREGDPQ